MSRLPRCKKIAIKAGHAALAAIGYPTSREGWLMRRREFIAGLGGAAAWPLVARGQQTPRMRRIGVLMPGAADDPEAPAQVAALAQGLQEHGWTIGRNVEVDYRWGANSDESARPAAVELVALRPDILVAATGSTVRALQRATRTVPIVFARALDPVGGGLVESLAKPGGNTTGFAGIEYGVTGKWPELLKQIAPRVSRAAVIRDPTAAGGGGQMGAVQTVAPLFGLEVNPIDSRDAGEMERAITAFAQRANGGVIVTMNVLATRHRKLIITLATRHQLPAVYPLRYFVSDGGLISYGPVWTDNFRSVAGYVDRILKGEKPADLPVQAPSKYELAINLNTAKSLGLTIPETLLATADEVIQ
jgi:putative ABC transport system substrate-binding protein